MTVCRRATALGSTVLAVSGVLALAGCEKPNPYVSVFAGTSVEQVEAACWSRADKPVKQSECTPTGSGEEATLRVSAGQTIGISVDPVIADAGWVPTVNDQQIVARPIESTYYRFALGEQNLSQGQLTLRVLAVTSGAQPQQRGAWVFRLGRA